MPGKAAPKKNLSALKRVRQTEKRNLRNKAVRSAIKTSTKKLETAATGKNKDEVRKAFKEAVKVVSKAASKGIIHRNTASRRISRLARIANSALKPEAA